MADINIAFCRVLLARIMDDVRQHATPAERRGVSVLKSGSTTRPWYLVEGLPEPMTYWEGEADNAYEARYKAWSAWLRKKGVAEYQS